jgi:ABC-type polysaccharide/polyol phosphate export permease
VDNVQGYHAIQMTLLVPLWIVSGAMFPAGPDRPVLAAVLRANPVAYAVSATRVALAGPGAPGALPGTPARDLLVLALFAGVNLALAVLVARRGSAR